MKSLHIKLSSEEKDLLLKYCKEKERSQANVVRELIRTLNERLEAE